MTLKFRAWHLDGTGFHTMHEWSQVKNSFKQYLDDSSCKLMQLTGLTDKNGKDIYEGDILTFAAGFELQRGAIIFHNGSFMFDINKPFFATRNPAYNAINMQGSEARIIGNIHQHPELMDRGNNND